MATPRTPYTLGYHKFLAMKINKMADFLVQAIIFILKTIISFQ